MPGPLLDTLNGSPTGTVPLWLMRQAGRYLPEYRELRAEKGGFLAMAYDSEAACEITLQPINRFGFDGAILFSDILIVPHALGQHLEFLAGEGPKLSPRLVDAALAGFDQQELVTIPSLPDAADWDAFVSARAALGPNLSHNQAAARYK